MRSLLGWKVIGRAEITRRIAHGERYLQTRVFLANGRVLEQVNPGIADLDNDWREIGRSRDPRSDLAELERSGWTVRA